MHGEGCTWRHRWLLTGTVVGVALAGAAALAERWQSAPPAVSAAAIARGRYDFSTGSCISCHTLMPISYAGGGTDLTHEGRRRSYPWLQHEIRFPTSRRPPTPPGQADDLAAFLSSLK